MLYNVHWRVKLEAYTFHSLLLSSDALDNVLLAVISVYIVTTTFYWLLCQYIYILTTTFYYMLCLYISLQQRSISCYVNIYIFLQQHFIIFYVCIYRYNNALLTVTSIYIVTTTFYQLLCQYNTGLMSYRSTSHILSQLYFYTKPSFLCWH